MAENRHHKLKIGKRNIFFSAVKTITADKWFNIAYAFRMFACQKPKIKVRGNVTWI